MIWVFTILGTVIVLLLVILILDIERLNALTISASDLNLKSLERLQDAILEAQRDDDSIYD